MALAVIYLDMFRAFGRVPHPQLLSKVSSSGIAEPLLFCLSRYLTQRSQVAFINGITSNPRPVTGAVTQDSLLGSLLFFIYTMDALNSVSHGVPFQFTDDIIVVYPLTSNEARNVVRGICADLSALND